MMNEKIVVYINILNSYYQLRKVDDDSYCCRRLDPIEVSDLLNEQRDQIINMKKERKKLKEENELLKGELELESVKRMRYEQKFFQLRAKELGYND